MAFDDALERWLAGLGDADRRLVHTLAAGVLRQTDALDARLAPLASRGLDRADQRVRNILRLGAFQLCHLERIPSHAAVATAVELTRQRVGERATGFVNALLRKIAADPRAPLPNGIPLATAYSHPAWLVDRWQSRFGSDEVTALLEWNNSQPPLVVQPVNGDVAELSRRLAAAGVRNFPAPYNAGLVVEETRPELLPGFADGNFMVQDPAQSLVLRYAAFPSGTTVYDCCAAPGGKSLALAGKGQRVVAADRSRKRLLRLRENLDRTRIDSVFMIRADAAHPPIDRVDAVLLDAPCLGTGTFARHPDARLRVSPVGLARLVATQAELLDAAADRLRPGGVLCYATCSLEVEENTEQVERFLARQPGFRRLPVAGHGLPTNPSGDLELLPQRHGMDGAFAARLVRQE